MMMTELNLYKGDDHVVVSTETLLEIMKAVTAREGMDKKYLDDLGGFGEHIEVHPELVNAMKAFLHKNDLHRDNPAVAKVVSSPRGATSCFPKKRG
jgi:hypothetical protein